MNGPYAMELVNGGLDNNERVIYFFTVCNNPEIINFHSMAYFIRYKIAFSPAINFPGLKTFGFVLSIFITSLGRRDITTNCRDIGAGYSCNWPCSVTSCKYLWAHHHFFPFPFGDSVNICHRSGFTSDHLWFEMKSCGDTSMVIAIKFLNCLQFGQWPR